MAKISSRLPPPLPDRSESGNNSTKLLAALAGIVVLAAILVISLLFTKPDIADANGKGGSASTASGSDGQGHKNSGDGIDNGKDESGGGASPNTKSKTDTSESDENQATNGSGASASSEDVVSGGVAGDESSDVDQFLPPGVETEAPKSNRNVRNTFNPFGSTAPPKKASPKPALNEEGKSADFFGVAAEGKSFVYVVDKSSSMMMGKFDAAREQLIESIDGLRPNQKFFVIFFDSSYHIQPTKGLVPATFKNKKLVKEWMMRADPSAATEPYQAIEYAIELHPDAIYVLSDGEFDSSIVHQVSAINSEFTIPIHTIAFTTNAQTLKELADQNKGTYRYVP